MKSSILLCSAKNLARRAAVRFPTTGAEVAPVSEAHAMSATNRMRSEVSIIHQLLKIVSYPCDPTFASSPLSLTAVGTLPLSPTTDTDTNLIIFIMVMFSSCAHSFYLTLTLSN